MQITTISSGHWALCSGPLALVSVNIEGTIRDFSGSLSLTQSYSVPAGHDPRQVLSFEFPLYDLGIVTNFEVTVGKEVTRSVLVKKHEVQQRFQTHCESTFESYLELNSTDVFICKLRAVSPGSTISIRISFVCDLTLHSSTILRLLLPTTITPRLYTHEPHPTHHPHTYSLTLTLSLDSHYRVKSITSPSHKLLFDPSKGKLTLHKGPHSDFDLLLFLHLEKPLEAHLPKAYLEIEKGRAPFSVATMFAFLPHWGKDKEVIQRLEEREVLFVIDPHQCKSSLEPISQAIRSSLQEFMGYDKKVFINLVQLSSKPTSLFPESSPVTKENIQIIHDFLSSAEYQNHFSEVPKYPLTNAIRLLYPPSEFAPLPPASCQPKRSMFLFSDGMVSRPTELLGFVDSHAEEMSIFPFNFSMRFNGYVLKTLARLSAGSHEIVLKTDPPQPTPSGGKGNKGKKNEDQYAYVKEKVRSQIRRVMQPYIDVQMDWGNWKRDPSIRFSNIEHFWNGDVVFFYSLLQKEFKERNKVTMKVSSAAFKETLEFSLDFNPDNVCKRTVEKSGALHYQSVYDKILELAVNSEESEQNLKQAEELALMFGISSSETSFWGLKETDNKGWTVLLASISDPEGEENKEIEEENEQNEQEEENNTNETENQLNEQEENNQPNETNEQETQVDENKTEAQEMEDEDTPPEEKKENRDPEMDNEQKEKDMDAIRKYSVEFLLQFQHKNTAVPSDFNPAFQISKGTSNGTYGLPKENNSSTPMNKFGNRRDRAPVKTPSKAQRNKLAIKPQWNANAEELFRTINSSLNKLTITTFDKLKNKIISKKSEITSPDHLSVIVDMVYEKAINFPNYSTLYADLCLDLAQHLPEFDNAQNPKLKLNFRRCIIERCQTEFVQKKASNTTNLTGAELEEFLYKKRLRNRGNITFVGELFKRGLLVTNVVHTIIKNLLGLDREEDIIPDSVDLELTIKLYTTIGQKLQSQNHPNVSLYWNKFEKLSKEKRVEQRLTYLIRDLIDLHQRNWVSKKDAPKPTPSDTPKPKSSQDDISKRLDKEKLSGSRNNNREPNSARGKNPNPPRREAEQPKETPKEPQWKTAKSNTKQPPAQIQRPQPQPQSQPQPLQTAKVNNDEKKTALNATSMPTKPSLQLTKEQIEKKIDSLLAEWIDSEDPENAHDCFLEIPGAPPNQLVYQAICKGIEGKERDRQLMVQLIKILSTQYKDIPTKDILEGYRMVVEQIEDLALDIPNAYKFLGGYMAAAISLGLMAPGDVQELLIPVVESGVAAMVGVEVLCCMVKEKGVEQTKALEASFSMKKLLKTANAESQLQSLIQKNSSLKEILS